MIWTVPNLLTAGRLLAAPALVLPFLLLDRPAADAWALGIFLAAAVTDFLDGWLARQLGQESALGAMLDPIADKAMVLVALALLLTTAAQPWMVLIPSVVIVLREVLVSGLREHIGGAALKVTWLAKAKTTAQMLAVGALLAASTVGAGEMAALGLLWVAALLTAITGWDYAAKALAYIREREDG